MAVNIYFEARGSSQRDQWAVGQVTMNRVADPRRPDTICGVVWEHQYRGTKRRRVLIGQFAWTGERGRVELADDPAWVLAQQIAYILYVDPNVHDETNGALHFWNPDKVETPAWAIGRKGRKIGQHVYLVPEMASDR